MDVYDAQRGPFNKDWNWLFAQPSAPSVTLMAFFLSLAIGGAFIWTTFFDDNGLGAGNTSSIAQMLFRLYIRLGIFRNALFRSCDRQARKYQLANTCQIPHFKNLSDIYSFIFGYKANGLFVEIGAFDGESFSNTSGLSDMGWRGHYVEPIPKYAAVCMKRHAKNYPRVRVHNLCVGSMDGEIVEMSPAGPFSSAVEDEIASVTSSAMNKDLQVMGWSHESNSSEMSTETELPDHALNANDPPLELPSGKVVAITKKLDTFFESQSDLKEPGVVDVMVVDTEGFEWPILREFNLKHYRPKVVIVEIQEMQARYRNNIRVQEDATNLFCKFLESGYKILYKDAINTIFVHEDWPCVGGQ